MCGDANCNEGDGGSGDDGGGGGGGEGGGDGGGGDIIFKHSIYVTIHIDIQHSIYVIILIKSLSVMWENWVTFENVYI